jgi:hypothetical protein
MTIEKMNKLFMNYIQLPPPEEKLPGLFRGDIHQLLFLGVKHFCVIKLVRGLECDLYVMRRWGKNRKKKKLV